MVALEVVSLVTSTQLDIDTFRLHSVCLTDYEDVFSRRTTGIVMVVEIFRVIDGGSTSQKIGPCLLYV